MAGYRGMHFSHFTLIQRFALVIRASTCFFTPEVIFDITAILVAFTIIFPTNLLWSEYVNSEISTTNNSTQYSEIINVGRFVEGVGFEDLTRENVDTILLHWSTHIFVS